MDKEGHIPDTRRERHLQRRRRLEGRLAEAALGHHGLRGARIEPLNQRFVQVFRVASGREAFALRLYDLPRPGGNTAGSGAATRTGSRLRSPEVLVSQLAWLSDLGRETDLRAPEPMPLPDGSLLGRVSTHDLGPRGSLLRWASRRRDAEELRRDLWDAPGMCRNFVLLRWVPGGHKRGEDLKPEDLSLAGSYVARLHRHAEDFGIPEGATLPRWDWEWPFGETANLWDKGPTFYSDSDMDGFRAAARHVHEDLQRLGEGREVFGAIHRDLKLENLLFDGARVGAVDFDLCGLGYYIFDLWTVRNSLRTHHADRVEPLWDAFLAGYERERSLPEDLRRYLRTFEVMQKVATANRQIELLGHDNPAGLRQPDFLANVASWLKDLSRKWSILSVGFSERLGELPYVAAEFAAVV